MKLHEFLSEQREQLLAASRRITERDIPERRDDEVVEHLRGLLDDVVCALRRLDGDDSSVRGSPIGALDAAGDHPHRDLRAEYLVPAYKSLSVALGEVGGSQHLAFDAGEYGAFNQAIDGHVAEAIEAVSEDARRQRDQLVGERLGFFAHELRNALASALMASRSLERGQVGLDGRPAEVLRRSHRRMEILIDQMLVSARTRFGGVTAGLHEMPLVPLLHEIGSSAVLERGIGLAIDADESLMVVADEQLLTSVISNLLQNAVKFSHDDVSVMLRARDAGDSVVIEVEDRCGGLPSGKHQELFEPFVQGARDRRGVGLGLAITREAVRALGGEISVRDIPDQGCVFAIQLPHAVAPNSAAGASLAR